jgi:hypothetical protein
MCLFKYYFLINIETPFKKPIYSVDSGFSGGVISPVSRLISPSPYFS